ncbi:MAG: SPASM domain-containing protein, partial [Bacteroidia bacterium]|nr:SPASM domain-containing protein [Bacteroidia bacterium]
LKICATNRHKGMNIVLRTNLTGNFSDSFLVAIASAFDQVVVSVDGNEASHNARRGEGTYKTLIENIERYKNSVKNQTGAGELSLACVMNSHDINSEAGQSVRILANRLKIKRIRFRPLLPLGRAANMDEQLKYEGVHHYLSAQELLENDFKPLTSCGMGQNLYLEPDGDSFPCYAWHKPHTLLGNIEHLGLSHILASEAFQSLSKCNVDTIDKCKLCEYRYLCGGACRAWGNEENQKKLNAAPPRCDHLRLRAENLSRAARAYLTE